MEAASTPGAMALTGLSCARLAAAGSMPWSHTAALDHRAAVPTPVVAVLLRIISASFGTAANRLTACLPDPPVKEWVSVTEYLLLGQLRAL
jgi:hypothetical protein